ncbi:MAG: hypothetical protein KBC62_02755 [Candidatus Pacebacteria bacterium]|nr:hypothetical protein [Candidatus Paceibacterota bacterium]
MKTTIYREPNRFKRWWQRQLFSTEVAGQEMNFPRIRWWLPAGFLATWLGHNTLLILVYMAAAIQGRTVSFDASGWWYWPLRTFFQYF